MIKNFRNLWAFGVFMSGVSLSACGTLPEVPLQLDESLIASIPSEAAVSYMDKIYQTYNEAPEIQCRFGPEQVTFLELSFWGDDILVLRERNYGDLEYSVVTYPSDGSIVAFVQEADRSSGVTKGSKKFCLFTPRWGLEGVALAEARNDQVFEKLASAFASLGIERVATEE